MTFHTGIRKKAGKTGSIIFGLMVQPFVGFNLIKFWLKIFPIPLLGVGFTQLISWLNRFPRAIPLIDDAVDSQFFFLRNKAWIATCRDDSLKESCILVTLLSL
jgi:hypothetical protein